jgi:hypothetical protein
MTFQVDLSHSIMSYLSQNFAAETNTRMDRQTNVWPQPSCQGALDTLFMYKWPNSYMQFEDWSSLLQIIL